MAARLVASFVRHHSPTVSVSADLELESGDSRVMVLFGPSGSGKTTILRCLGMDHLKLTYKYQGRHFRLTDVHGEVVKDLLGVTRQVVGWRSSGLSYARERRSAN